MKGAAFPIPVASKMALAMAGTVESWGPSPASFAPNGPFASWLSTIVTSMGGVSWMVGICTRGSTDSGSARPSVGLLLDHRLADAHVHTALSICLDDVRLMPGPGRGRPRCGRW